MTQAERIEQTSPTVWPSHPRIALRNRYGEKDEADSRWDNRSCNQKDCKKQIAETQKMSTKATTNTEN